MEVEYKKDLRHNYMVITEDESLLIESYCIKMLEQQVEGILPLERRYMDNRILFYYDITAKQSMINLLEKVVLSYDKIYQLITRIFTTIEKAYDYLLPENDFILSPEFVYLDVITYAPSLCFLSGYKKDIKDQINLLLEYLMNKVDYNDKEAVFLVYQLYAVSREEGFTFDHLFEILQKQSTGLEIKSNIDKKIGENEVLNAERNNADRAVINSQNKGKPDQQEGCRNNLLTKSRKDLETKKDKHILGGQKKQAAKENQNIKKIPCERVKEDNNKKRELGISVMMERLEGETEIFYYPIKTYLITGVCIVGGIGIAILGFASKVLYNSFGNRIDYSKLFAMLLILLCVESYLLKILWDKKNRLTRLKKNCEYINPIQEADNNKTGLRKKWVTQESEKRPSEWQQESKIILPKEATKTPIEIFKMDTNKENNSSGERTLFDAKKHEQEEADNPTCLLNEKEEDGDPTCLLNNKEENLKIILKPLDEVNYHTIIIIDFPFFVGKLKKNVDYCLEKDVVSRFHAKITKEQCKYFITDLNSTNGTFVNQEALATYQKKEIQLGDEIAFANIKYRFQKS